MKKILIIISALIITAGCTKEEFRNVIGIDSEDIYGVNKVTASIEDGTRATFNYEIGQQEWVPQDEIAVATKRPIVKFVYSGEEQSAIGEFTSKETLVDTTLYYAAYPYSALDSVVFDKAGHWMAVKFPSKQTFDPSLSLAEGANLMVAKSTKKEENQPVFYFRNICSYIELVVLGPNDDKIESIVITSADHSTINGPAKVTWNGTEPEVSFTGEGSDTNVISMEDGGLDFSEIPFDIAVPASLENGFSITIVTANGLEQTLTTNKGVGRNKYLKMDPIDFNAQGACAKIGETEYKSFKAAVKAANSSLDECTIELISDCHTSTAVFENSSPVTLDLCGHRLTAVADRNISVSEESAGLTIKDSGDGQGTICQADRASHVIDVYGNLTIESGKFEAENTVIFVHAGSFTMNGGEVNGGTSSNPALRAKLADVSQEITGIEINGGSINSEKGRGLYTVGCTSTTINGGSIITSSYSIYVDEGQISIKDGEFVSSSNTIYIASKGHGTIEGGHFFTDAASNIGLIINKNDGNLKMSGGYCSRTVSDGILETGYWLNPVEETFNGRVYNFNVEEKPVIEATLQIGDGNPLEYNSVTEAIKDAQGAIDEDCIVVLKANCKLTEKIEITSRNKITIDLNGFILLSASASRIEIVGNESDVTIKSSADGGAMEQNATGTYTLSQNAGTFTLESGEIRSAASATVLTYDIKGGTVNIKGGKIVNTGYTRVLQASASTGSCSVNISGGEIECTAHELGTSSAIYFGSNASVNISGGKMSNVYASSSVADFTLDEGSQINIDTLYTFHPLAISNGKFGPMALLASADVNITGGEFTATGNKSALTLTGSKAVNISGGTFTAEKGIALDVQKGTANVSGGEFTSSNIGIRTAYTTNISGGTVTVTGEEGKNAFALYLGNSSLKGTSPVFNISAGKFSSSFRTLHRYSGSLSISGGTFIANEVAVAGGNVAANVEVTGGYFSTSSDDFEILTGTNFNNAISGGSFNKAISTDYLKAGCSLSTAEPETIEGITYTHKVVGEYYPAQVNDTKYTSFEGAVEAANALGSACTLTLLDDVAISSVQTFTNANGITIDLAGHKIDAGSVYLKVDGGNLTVDDSSTDKNGEINADGLYTIYSTSAGTLTVNAGNLKNSTKKCIYSNGGNCITTINGGTVTATDSAAIAIYAGKCTITGGTVESANAKISPDKANNTGWYIGTVSARGAGASVAISGGTIKNTKGVAVYGLGASSKKVEINISDGILESSCYTVYPYFYTNTKITGGNMSAIGKAGYSSYCVYTNTAVTYTAASIEGGYFKGNSGVVKASSENVITLTGGSYNMDPKKTYSDADTKATIPEGYEVVDNGEGQEYRYSVKAK